MPQLMQLRREPLFSPLMVPQGLRFNILPHQKLPVVQPEDRLQLRSGVDGHDLLVLEPYLVEKRPGQSVAPLLGSSIPCGRHVGQELG